VVQITEEDFLVEEVIEGMRKPGIGGIITYLGTVRNFSGDKEVEKLEFDVDEASIGKIKEVERKALGDFDIEAIVIIHRIGSLKVGDKILLVAVSAPHRQPAFAACMGLIDDIKGIHSSWVREVLKVS